MAFKTYDSNNNLIDTPLVEAGVYTTDTSHVYADNVAQLNNISVYLNKSTKEQTFIIFQSNKRDTINVFYQPDTVFVSNGCGFRADFAIERVAFRSESIDSVNIKSNIVSEQVNDTHFEIIYK